MTIKIFVFLVSDSITSPSITNQKVKSVKGRGSKSNGKNSRLSSRNIFDEFMSSLLKVKLTSIRLSQNVLVSDYYNILLLALQ